MYGSGHPECPGGYDRMQHREEGSEWLPTGTLRNATLSEHGPILSGEVFADTKGRFADGERITTSRVLRRDGDIFTTKNSVYRVESWAGDEREQLRADSRATHINSLVAYFHAKSSAAGWWDEDGRDLRADKYVHATKLMLVVTELAEAMEGLRKDLQDDKLPHRKMAEVELADALIRICDLAGVLGYDLGGAVVEKDAYNSIREDHKPGNRKIAGGKAY